MAQTNAPPGAPSESDQLVAQLLDLLAQRRETLDEIRRGAGHVQRDAILLELCAFRGMQYTEAGAAIGYTREGVARRVRPMIEEMGLTHLSLIERTRAKVERPHRDATLDELLAMLHRPKAAKTQDKRALAGKARDQRREIVKRLEKLHKAGMSWVDLADRLDVSVPTIQRLRGVM